MTSQTQFPKGKLPGARPVMRKLELALPAPPSERRAALPELELFVFDGRRRLVGRAPVEGGRARLEGDLGPTRLLKAVVAPRGLSPEAVAANAGLPQLVLEAPGQAVIEMPHDWWEDLVPGFLVKYHGRVEKVIGESTLPIRDGTVEVHEVDPKLILAKLPPLELLRLRDDLLRILEARLPGLAVPPQPPGPDPVTGVLPEALRHLEMAGTPVVFGAPQPVTPMPAALPTLNLGDLQPVLLKALPVEALRSYLQLHQQALLPLLPLLFKDWWYTKSKIGEVPIQPDGTFHGCAGFWFPGQDRPDLWFRVRQVIEGVEKVIFSPKVAGNTWWNYAGETVVLRVTDPQAVAVDESLVAQDDQVVFLGLGFDTTTDMAGEPGLVQCGPELGLYRHPGGKLAPYGHVLHVALDVDLYGLKAAGVSYYRLSWRRGAHAAVGDPNDWVPLTTPISRHYREVKNVGGQIVVSYPVVSMVPAPASLPAPLSGKVGVLAFADPVRDYVVIDSTDRAFGIWNTEALHGGDVLPGDVSDTYTLRLELFDVHGADVTATTPILRIRRRETDGSYSTTHLAAGQPFAYVHVDNRPMVAEICDTITAGTTSTGTGCGFLVAPSGADVEVGLRAYHPGGVGHATDPDRFLDSWRYEVKRGAGATSCIDVTVTDRNVGSPSAWQDVPYAPDIPVQTVSGLLAGTTPFGGQRRCTFTLQLTAAALTRNGYGRLAHLDREDHAAFALIERNA